MLEVGITGGIGSGKSLVSKLFSLLGIPVYDADSRAKWLMANNPALITQIKSKFGARAYVEGSLNRKFLADMVFKDKSKISILNKLVHPIVGDDYKYWVIKNENSPYVLKEAALLFESGSYKQLDKIITVFAPLEVRVNRTLKRDKQRNREQVLAIVKNQWDDNIKLEKADFIVYNDESRMVIPQILEVDKILRNI